MHHVQNFNPTNLTRFFSSKDVLFLKFLGISQIISETSLSTGERPWASFSINDMLLKLYFLLLYRDPFQALKEGQMVF